MLGNHLHSLSLSLTHTHTHAGDRVSVRVLQPGDLSLSRSLSHTHTHTAFATEFCAGGASIKKILRITMYQQQRTVRCLCVGQHRQLKVLRGIAKTVWFLIILFFNEHECYKNKHQGSDYVLVNAVY